MHDTNLVDFYSRLARYERSHAEGYAHEADGTLGRAATYGLHKTRRRIRVLPMVFVVVAAIGMKATILHFVGATDYQARVEKLNAGEGFDRLGGWLMQVDPVTAMVAAKIAEVTSAVRG